MQNKIVIITLNVVIQVTKEIMTDTNKIVLDPHAHREAVGRFLDFFNIKSGRPDADFLQNILKYYTRLPYENISKILKLHNNFISGTHIRLPDEVIEDHAEFHFGGTCFSLTFYLQAILSTRGFLCYPVMAHTLNRLNVHTALIVLLNRRKYLVDPGYLLTQPMEIHQDKPRLYRTPHTGVELGFNPKDEYYHLYTFNRQQKKWRYRFQDRPVSSDEYLHHWQDSFYQGTMHGICLTRVKKDGMIYMHNDFLQITSIEGKQKRKVKENYYSVIEDIFGFAPEIVEQAKEAMTENMKLERQLGFYKEKKAANETD